MEAWAGGPLNDPWTLPVNPSPFCIHHDGSAIRLEGELDLATAGELESLLARFCAQRERVAVDLSDLTFIDSTGLAVLLNARKRADGNGCAVTLVNVPEVARRVFDLTGTADYLDAEAG